MTKSQIEPSEIINQMVENISTPVTPEGLVVLRDQMYSKIQVRPYNDDSKEHERGIRWKRTAAEILEDGYVYDGKSCTDLVVVFLALCAALGLEERFVKLKKENKVHSVAEIKLQDGWYIFDVSRKDNLPVQGEITNEHPYKDWQRWGKGRDAWDLGLVDFESLQKIQ